MFEQLGVEIPIYLAHLANILYPKVFNFDIRKMELLKFWGSA